MELTKAIKERHSVTSFKKTKTPDYHKIIEAIEAASKAPLAANHPSLRFILIQDKDKIKKIAEASMQDFVGDVNFILLVCSDKTFLKKSYNERGEIYSRQQAGASIQNLLLKITDLGLATCWIGAFNDETIKRLIKIPDNIDIEALFPIWY